MKNKLLYGLLAFLIIGLLPTVFISAEKKDEVSTPAADLQALIEKLQSQIKELQEQLTKLKSEVQEVKEELKLTKNLYKGLSDEEVKKLQAFLKQYAEVYPEGLVTGYYGPLTEKAIKKFQEKHDIPTTGLVGPLTREKINEFLAKEEKEEKVTICHIPLGNLAAKHTLTIGKSALEAHLAHGDAVGVCLQEPAPTSPLPITPAPTPTPSTPTTIKPVFDECGNFTSKDGVAPVPIPITSGLGCNGVVSITDSRDTNNPLYETVEIGNQCWLKRNLNVGIYVTDVTAQTNNNIVEKYCYGNITAYCNTYGGLYQYDEAINYYSDVPAETDVIQGICPAGWHIPRSSEWNTLATYLGGTSTAGEKMKEAGFARNITDDNSSGFTAYGAGRHDIINRFHYLGAVAFFWSSLPCGATNALYRHINSDEIALYRVSYYRSSAISVRCIKD